MSATRFLPGPWMLSLVVLSIACAPEDQRTDSVDATTAGRELPAAARAQLDSGNVAYTAGDFDGALGHYLRVSEIAPEDAAGWFGVYMAHEALGNPAAADSALNRARRLNPGASLIRDTAGTR